MSDNKVPVVAGSAMKHDGRDVRIGETIYVDRQLAADMKAMRQARDPSPSDQAPAAIPNRGAYSRRDMRPIKSR
jgi:hypothetical protein